jgi:hypothetical protein
VEEREDGLPRSARWSGSRPSPRRAS